MATSAPTAPAAPRQLHFALLFMRPNADNLRLVGCTANAGGGDYLCGFTHGVPPATHLAGTGHALHRRSRRAAARGNRRCRPTAGPGGRRLYVSVTVKFVVAQVLALGWLGVSGADVTAVGA